MRSCVFSYRESRIVDIYISRLIVRMQLTQVKLKLVFDKSVRPALLRLTTMAMSDVTINEVLESVTWAANMTTTTGYVRVLDSTTTGFVVTKGGAVRVKRNHQKNPHFYCAEQEGDWEVGYIGHGLTPSNQGYEYTIMLDTTVTELQRFNPPEQYPVFQRTDSLHHNFKRHAQVPPSPTN